MKEFPHKCCRCGFCCLSITCKAGQAFFKVGDKERCPGLTWEGDQAACELAKRGYYQTVGVGMGCCIKARALQGDKTFDFAALPEEAKKAEAQKLRRSAHVILDGQDDSLMDLIQVPIPITLPKMLWLALTGYANADFKGDIDAACQAIFMAGVEQRVKVYARTEEPERDISGGAYN